ncbi:MAG TPA: G1 family glutamic endopeptidase [Ktedonobacterales bacterium]|nr:G1 family glutamic endopeptidase [Ktedonobacterales bacterium]
MSGQFARRMVWVIVMLLSLPIITGSFTQAAHAQGSPGIARLVNAAGTCLQPPTNLDLATLSDSALVQYGLLPRPRDVSQIAKWEEVIHHSLHRSCSQVATNRVAGRHNTDNWAGNVATGSGYTDIYANWHVPCVSGTTRPSYSAQWVGLAGYTNGGNLLQIGTEQNIDSNGGAHYDAWWEDLADPQFKNLNVINNFPVGCQDYVYASTFVDEVYIDDYTTNSYFDKVDSSYPGGNQAADWIVERQSANGSPLPLANFSSYEAQFYNSTTEQNTVFKNVGSTSHDSQYMCTDSFFGLCGTGSTLLANPTAITPDGTSFGVNWDHS